MSLAVFAMLWQHAHRQAASPLEYVAVAVAAVITAYALVRTVQATIRPGESEPDHIKRTVLDEEPIVGKPSPSADEAGNRAEL